MLVKLAIHLHLAKEKLLVCAHQYRNLYLILTLTSLFLFQVVSFHSVAFVLGLNPCCCNNDSYSFTLSGVMILNVASQLNFQNNCISPSLCLQT